MGKLRDYVWPLVREELDEFYEVLLRCYKCRYCHYVFAPDCRDERFVSICPSGDRWRFDAYYASGKMELARGLVEGKLMWSDNLSHILYTCTTCGACHVWGEFIGRCYPLFIIERLRKGYVENVGPLPQHKALRDNIMKHGNPYCVNSTHYSMLLEDLRGVSARAETMYFVGCTTAYKRHEIASATIDLLKKLGVDFGVLRSEKCCGSLLARLGLVDEGAKLLEENINALKEAGAKRVVFSCPECLKMFNDADRYGLKKPDFEFLHVTQLLEEKASRLRFELNNLDNPPKAAYHDSCYLGRHLLIFESPRNLVKSIEGVEYVEFLRNRRNAWCCGAGGGVAYTYPEFASWVAQKRLEEAKYIGVNVLATACPHCKDNLLKASKDFNIEVYDIVELLSKALKREGGR
ncbi:MAG: (Fe-S)-binding protein [Candidatus Nezhaarchaeota archaeon]|nr:(Fe-S)-binding protein [Candidatus Nezhaarchaeota archaeon]